MPDWQPYAFAIGAGIAVALILSVAGICGIRPVSMWATFPAFGGSPHGQRQGAIVKGEHDLPIRERSYRKWFRQIARAAGIPDQVWSMDSRAGAATEAEEAGVELDAISAALTHGSTGRYIRRRTTKIASVAEARARKRAADNDGSGTA
jgi:hypothetical protein